MAVTSFGLIWEILPLMSQLVRALFTVWLIQTLQHKSLCFAPIKRWNVLITRPLTIRYLERKANAINHKRVSGFSRGHGQFQKALPFKSYWLRVESLKSWSGTGARSYPSKRHPGSFIWLLNRTHGPTFRILLRYKIIMDDYSRLSASPFKFWKVAQTNCICIYFTLASICSVLRRREPEPRGGLFKKKKKVQPTSSPSRGKHKTFFCRCCFKKPCATIIMIQLLLPSAYCAQHNCRWRHQARTGPFRWYNGGK